VCFSARQQPKDTCSWPEPVAVLTGNPLPHTLCAQTTAPSLIILVRSCIQICLIRVNRIDEWLVKWLGRFVIRVGRKSVARMDLNMDRWSLCERRERRVKHKSYKSISTGELKGLGNSGDYDCLFRRVFVRLLPRSASATLCPSGYLQLTSRASRSIILSQHLKACKTKGGPRDYWSLPDRRSLNIPGKPS
jgi:hypothetical protein